MVEQLRKAVRKMSNAMLLIFLIVSLLGNAVISYLFLCVVRQNKAYERELIRLNAENYCKDVAIKVLQ
jgi:hypothetical protein